MNVYMIPELFLLDKAVTAALPPLPPSPAWCPSPPREREGTARGGNSASIGPVMHM